MNLKSFGILLARILGGLLFVALAMVFFMPLGGNLWFLLTEPVYILPAESSIFTFRPTVLNPGSGDWWIYGEDNRNYYFFTGEKEQPYGYIPRKEADDLAGFDPQDFSSWP